MTCKNSSLTKCTSGETTMCLVEGEGWGSSYGSSSNWSDEDCGSCVGEASGCSNGLSCNRSRSGGHYFGSYEYSCATP